MRDRELNCKRGVTNTCTYVPRNIVDNKCVILSIATYSCKRERERERERETDRKRQGKVITRQGAKLYESGYHYMTYQEAK